MQQEMFEELGDWHGAFCCSYIRRSRYLLQSFRFDRKVLQDFPLNHRMGDDTGGLIIESSNLDSKEHPLLRFFWEDECSLIPKIVCCIQDTRGTFKGVDSRAFRTLGGHSKVRIIYSISVLVYSGRFTIPVIPS